MPTIADIQGRFPNPQSVCADSACPKGYCVGGALYHTAFPTEYVTGYPVPALLQGAILALQPHWTRVQAFRLALLITRANDQEDFPQAWALAAEALAGPQPEN